MSIMEYKTALVTGASRGIGKAIADTLETAGANVIRWSSRDYDFNAPDILDRLDVPECDILVNNAGRQYSADALDYPLDWWEADLRSMLTVPFYLAKIAAAGMFLRGGGKIINIASIAGIQGTRRIIGYSVAKAGLIHMTKCLSNELALHNIQVNAIVPGYIRTDMLEPLLSDKQHAAQMIGRIPAGCWGKPEEVAQAALFLASPASDYITGTVIPVDGGWLAR
jgi:2-deoxy-D-gluconate 3-dehydrogenase